MEFVLLAGVGSFPGESSHAGFRRRRLVFLHDKGMLVGIPQRLPNKALQVIRFALPV
jgi:hypothetical protein